MDWSLCRKLNTTKEHWWKPSNKILGSVIAHNIIQLNGGGKYGGLDGLSNVLKWVSVFSTSAWVESLFLSFIDLLQITNVLIVNYGENVLFPFAFLSNFLFGQFDIKPNPID